jgi:hypothetical protein
MHLHVLHVSASCGHRQAHKAFTITFLSYVLYLRTLASVRHWECAVQVCWVCNVLML